MFKTVSKSGTFTELLNFVVKLNSTSVAAVGVASIVYWHIMRLTEANTLISYQSLIFRPFSQ